MKHLLLRVDAPELVPFALAKARALSDRGGVSEQYLMPTGTVRLARRENGVVMIWIEAGALGVTPVVAIHYAPTGFASVPDGIALPTLFALSSDYYPFPDGGTTPTTPPVQYWEDSPPSFSLIDLSDYVRRCAVSADDNAAFASPALGSDPEGTLVFVPLRIAGRNVLDAAPDFDAAALPAANPSSLIPGGTFILRRSPPIEWVTDDYVSHLAHAIGYSDGVDTWVEAVTRFDNAPGDAGWGTTGLLSSLTFSHSVADLGGAIMLAAPTGAGAVAVWSSRESTGAGTLRQVIRYYLTTPGTRGTILSDRVSAFQVFPGIGANSSAMSDNGTHWVYAFSASTADPGGSGLYRGGIDLDVYDGTTLRARIQTDPSGFAAAVASQQPMQVAGRIVNDDGVYVYPLSIVGRSADNAQIRFRQGFIYGTNVYVETDNHDVTSVFPTYPSWRLGSVSDDGRLMLVVLPRMVGMTFYLRYILVFDGATVKTIAYTSVTATGTRDSPIDYRVSFVSSSVTSGVETRVYQIEAAAHPNIGPRPWTAWRVEVVDGAVEQLTFEKRSLSYGFGSFPFAAPPRAISLSNDRQKGIDAWDTATEETASAGFRVDVGTDTVL